MIRRIRDYPSLLWFGAALALLAGAFQFTDHLLDLSATETLDLAALGRIAAIRSPMLTNFFVNWTALGSNTLIALHTIAAFVLLMSTGDRAGAIQLAAASAGATLLTSFVKGWIERPRPTAAPFLVEVTGSSYPSGHALAAAAMYVTIAILLCRHLTTFRQRVIACALAGIVVAGVGVSRVYLGVHYPSDVLIGIGLGTAWALTLAGIVSMLEQRAIRKRKS